MSSADPQGEHPPQPPAPTASLKLIGTLGAIAFISGVLVVSVVEWTRPLIAENREAARRAAVLEVIPGAVEQRAYVLTERGLALKEEASASKPLVYAGYDEQGRFQGAALEASGRGYEGVIRLLYGYDPRSEEIVGMSILESQETPGLGDQIETDPDFQASFEGLAARLDEDGDGLAHRIHTVEAGEADAPGEIDGITGATVSSEAVGDMVHKSAERLLPQLAPHWSELERNE